MKKVVAIILAALFVLSFATVALAADGQGDASVVYESGFAQSAASEYTQDSAAYKQAANALAGYTQSAASANLGFTSPTDGGTYYIDGDKIPLSLNVNGAALSGKTLVAFVVDSNGSLMQAFSSLSRSSMSQYTSSPLTQNWYPSWIADSYGPAYKPGAYTLYACATDSTGAVVYEAATATVSLKQAPTVVHAQQPDLNMSKGAKLKLKATVWPENAYSKKVTYKSDKPKIVSVNASTGALVAKGTGSATITLTAANGVTGKVWVYVTANKYSTSTLKIINAKKKVIKSLTMKVGEMQYVGGQMYILTSNNLMAWSSKNPGIVKAYPDGALVAQKPGSATIVLKCAGKTATLKVKVK